VGANPHFGGALDFRLPSDPGLKEGTRLQGDEILLGLPPAFPLTVRKEALEVVFAQVGGKHARHGEADSVLRQKRENGWKAPSNACNLKAQVNRAFAELEPPNAVVKEVFIAKLEMGLPL